MKAVCSLISMVLVISMIPLPLYAGTASSGRVPGEILVKFRPGTGDGVRTRVMQQQRAEPLRQAYGKRFWVLGVQEQTLPDVVAALNRHPAVEYAEPNYLVYATAFPNDPLYEKQWNFGLINLEGAWEISSGQGVTVAVLDSGVNPNVNPNRISPLHFFGEDGFGGRLLEGYNGFLGVEAFWEDENFHGTHVAGTVGQETNNGVGVAGVAFGADILPVKVLSNRWTGGGTVAAAANGMYWAVDHGADIFNMSFGGTSTSKTLEQAVAYAYNQGVFMVAAAGNDGDIDNPAVLMPLNYPAGYSQVLAVGAVTYRLERSFYSNGGPELDVVAPGGSYSALDLLDVNRLATFDETKKTIYQETFRRRWGFRRFALGWDIVGITGTSMAAPHVAGVAALIKSIHPDWGPDDIREAIVNTAVDLGFPGRDNEYGFGLVDAEAALQY